MRIRRVQITGFRGLTDFSWEPSEGLNLIIGSGDSCKSTLLDAIELGLSPRWNPSFSDADFHGGKAASPILIDITIGDLPTAIMTKAKYETSFRGWQPGTLSDEPGDADELVITVRLSVDSSLEPHWFAWTDRRGEDSIPLNGKDREELGLVRVGTYIDRHLNWGKGSALSGFSGKLDHPTAVLAEVGRASRDALQKDKLEEFSTITKQLTVEAQKLGVRIKTGLEPGLDHSAIRDGSSALSLFDGDIPARQMGLGSRRLLTAAMQLGRPAGCKLLVVDEVENALEPYRIRQFMRILCSSGIQVFGTTHSTVALSEIGEGNLVVLKEQSHDGTPSIVPVQVGAHIKLLLKKGTELLFSRKVVCCEGQTEKWAVRALKEQWVLDGADDLDALGVVEFDAGGCRDVGKYAKELADLGFNASVLADSDAPIPPGVPALTALGVGVFQFTGSCSIEQRIFLDVPEDAIDEILQLAASLRTQPAQFNHPLRQEFGIDKSVDPTWETIKGACADAGEARARLGKMAKDIDWFKCDDGGYHLMKLVLRDWETVKDTPLGATISGLQAWCYAQ